MTVNFVDFGCWLISRPPIETIMRLMTVWRITGKIIRTAIMLIIHVRI